MSDNPAKHEVLIEQYLRSILDISVKYMYTFFLTKVMIIMTHASSFEKMVHFSVCGLLKLHKIP